MDAGQPISRFLLCLTMSACASAEVTGPIPPVETILTKMAVARAENRARFRSYKVTREYKLFGKEKQKPKSHIVADVTFVPPDSKQYVIQQTPGLTGLGERIVRQMLDGEAEAVKNYGATDLSSANYDFRFLRAESWQGRRCFVLEQIPKRPDRHLLHGTMWVDAETYMPHRFAGEPTKAPSWWLREARIDFIYGDVEGMWLQVGSESSANVRIFGPYTMTSRDVTYQVGEAAAHRQP